MKNLLKVMVVDDTSIYRMVMREVAESFPGVRVTDFAPNGRVALEKLGRQPVDVVLLDVEMPEMDGLTALRHIVEKYPAISVIMISATSRSNATIVVECLNSGALDFITKPYESSLEVAKKSLTEELGPLLKVAADKAGKGEAPPPPAPAIPRPATARQATAPMAPPPAPAGARKKSTWEYTPIGTAKAPAAPGKKNLRKVLPMPGAAVGTPPPAGAVSGSRGAPAWNLKPALLLIGSSTGGPAALTQLFKGIPSGFSVPIMIVQHMPPMFTAPLAAQLTRTTGHKVQEASEGQEIKPGVIVLAPGGLHMVAKKQGGRLTTAMHDGPKVNGCRPAVDVLFMSVMAMFDEPVLAVILTGMGRDGANGVKGLKQKGKTYCITQNQASCVVYGMPRAADELGVSDESVQLDQIGATIARLCQ